MSAIVQELLSLDAKYRKSGVQDDLFVISDLKARSWDHSLPTLCKFHNVFVADVFKETTTEQITTKFNERYLHLCNINWDNIIVAGGAIGAIVKNKNYNNDVDMFMYGLNTDDATSKIEEICEQMVEESKKMVIKKLNKRKKRPDDYKYNILESELNIKYLRTKNSLTIDIDGIKYQFIFRIYNSISEILHGFDIGSSAIGYNTTNTYVTSLGKFAYEYNCNIIDTTRRSTSYEHRLTKYFNRGFDIIMPQFDINKVSSELYDNYELTATCQMPYLVFTYSKVFGNQIIISKFYKKKYANTYDYDYADGDEFALFYRNIGKLIDEKTNEIFYVSDSYRKILYEPECFSPARIKYFYDVLHKKILSNTFPHASVEKYMNVTTPLELFKIKDDHKAVSKIFTAQCNELALYINNIDTDINWITENAGSQLSGSFNPIIEDASEWYGTYFLVEE